MYGPLSKMVMVAKKAAPSVARAAVPRVAAPVVVGGAGGQWSIRAESTTPSTSGADWARPGVREGPIPAEFPEGSIFQREKEGDIFRQVYFDVDENDPNIDPEFRAMVNDLFVEHKPSKHPFFANLKTMKREHATNKGFLSEFYKRYQAAMHITRAMVWYAPYLDDPVLRQRKCAIIADDDALEGKMSHHKQLEVMFTAFGAECLPESAFGEPNDLRAILDPKTTEFVNTVVDLYPKTTGAWCIAEVLSDDWLSALADSFSAHFGEGVKDYDYFDEIISGHLEVLHMLETVSLSENVMARHPEVAQATKDSMKEMAAALDGLWDNLNELVLKPEAYLS